MTEVWEAEYDAGSQNHQEPLSLTGSAEQAPQAVFTPV